jgi:CDP-glycerol glycerophosphotransferase (TagB/SpsB family)
MLMSEKPNVIIIQDEYLWTVKSYLVIPAKLQNVPTLALQHAIISPSHEGYIFLKGEIEPNGCFKSPFNQIADKTAVYGEYYKHLLTNLSAYPEESITVTGQPRYDILASVKNSYSKKDFIDKYHIPSNHKIILWLTQSHGLSEKENNKNLNAFFKTMQQIENATLVIKQHPGESEVNTKMITDYLNKSKVNAVIIPKKSDTYEALFIADVIVTKDSTTGIEAMALNKPVIVLNLSGKPDLVDYVNEGAAVGVYSSDTLKDTIERLLKNHLLLVGNGEKYLEKYLYKIDGKAAERVIKIIENIVKSNINKCNNG